MSSASVERSEAPGAHDRLSIEVIRRKLSSEVVGCHMYLFGRVASTCAILRRLADEGARPGVVVLSDDGIGLRLSVLFRPGRPLQAVGAHAGVAGEALAEAMRRVRLPAALTVSCAVTAHRTEWLIVDLGVEFGGVCEGAWREIDRNAFVTTFLNLLDRGGPHARE